VGDASRLCSLNGIEVLTVSDVIIDRIGTNEEQLFGALECTFERRPVAEVRLANFNSRLGPFFKRRWISCCGNDSTCRISIRLSQVEKHQAPQLAGGACYENLRLIYVHCVSLTFQNQVLNVYLLHEYRIT
jgi:hypothetical protein